MVSYKYTQILGAVERTWVVIQDMEHGRTISREPRYSDSCPGNKLSYLGKIIGLPASLSHL